MRRRELLSLVCTLALSVGACGNAGVPSVSGVATAPAGQSATPVAAQSLAPTSSAVSSEVPAPSQTVEPVRAYTSQRFAYSIEYPAEWVMTAATGDWPSAGFPFPDGNGVDRFGPTADSSSWMYVSSLLLKAGETTAGVPLPATEMDDARVAELDAENPLMCTLGDRKQVTVDGVAGRQEDQYCFGKDHIVEVLVSNDVRLYLIDILSHAPLTEGDRSRFDRFVASFRFPA